MKTTNEQRESMRFRANQEGVAIGGYHVLRLLDDIAELIVERDERDRLLKTAVDGYTGRLDSVARIAWWNKVRKLLRLP